jgi:hypothetical protein
MWEVTMPLDAKLDMSSDSHSWDVQRAPLRDTSTCLMALLGSLKLLPSDISQENLEIALNFRKFLTQFPKIFNPISE